MASLFELLMGGSGTGGGLGGLLGGVEPQGAAGDPWGGMRAAGGQVQTPQSFFQRLLDPTFAIPMAAGMMGDQGNMANIGQGFANTIPFMMQNRRDRAQVAERNKTYGWFQSNAPEYAQLMDAGMEGNDALGLYARQKYAKPDQQSLVNAGDGRLYDPNSGQWITAPGSGNTDVDQRRQSASELGMTPEDPRYQSYVLTGKFPREDAQALTATDKRAILEADEMVMTADSALPILQQALDINDQAYDGMGAGSRGWIAGNLGFEGGEKTMEFDNLIQQQGLSQLKATFGAAPTEGERKILLEIAGSSSQPANVRKGILERAMRLVENRQKFYRQRAAEMRDGEFYRQGGGTPAADAPGRATDYKTKYGLD